MSLFYNHSNNSIRIEHTLEEYMNLLSKNSGIQYWVGLDNIDKRIKYRHELAHFSSYNSTGLMELHALFVDYRLSILYTYINHKSKRADSALQIPIIEDEYNVPDDELDRTFLKAIQNVKDLEAYFFGWGTYKSLEELLDYNLHSSLLNLLDKSIVMVSSIGFLRFIKQLWYTTQRVVTMHPILSLPYVRIDNEHVHVSTRAVLEAYAISIETIAEHYKTVIIDGQKGRTEPKRVPNANYLLAIEIVLQTVTSEEIEIEDFVLGRLKGTRLYWCVNAISMAAMQVPVIEDEGGASFIFMGSIKQLNPAHRFIHIVQGIEEGTIPNPIDVKDYYDRDQVLKWFDTCNRAIGDPWTYKLYENTWGLMKIELERKHENNEREFVSARQLTKLGRHNWFENPSDFIMEGGLFNTQGGFSIRRIITSDNKVLHSTNGAEEDKIGVWNNYIVESSQMILEAALTGQMWKTNWKKLALPSSDKARRVSIESIFIHNLVKAGYSFEEAKTMAPKFKIRKEFSVN